MSSVKENEKELNMDTTVSKEQTKDKKEKKKRILRRLLGWLIFLLWTAWFWVPVTETIELDLDKVQSGSVQMVLITDLHSCYYGKDQQNLIKRIEKANPDMILFGGDIFDDKLKDDNAKLVFEQLVKKYPCYYVTGNHEFWSERVDEFKEYLRGIGVHVLAGDCETIQVGENWVDICGVDDPTEMSNKHWMEQMRSAYEKTDDSHLKVLISHRPECVEDYAKFDFDLVVAGHAHAGQFMVPFINKGLYVPNQGPFAEYVNGKYELSNGSILVISRGLARESTPLPRYFNHPEIVVIKVD